MISSMAMDQLAGTKGTLPAEREAQFLHLRGSIERIASDLFDEMPTSGGKVRVFYHRVRQREMPSGDLHSVIQRRSIRASSNS